MKNLISCAYNMDNCCVELKFTDGSMMHTPLKMRSQTGEIEHRFR